MTQSLGNRESTFRLSRHNFKILKTAIAQIHSSKLLGKATGRLALEVSAGGIGFVNTVLLARLLGTTEFGVYSILIAAANLFATFALLGLPTFVTRETAINLANEQWRLLKGLHSVTHRWVKIASLIIISAILVFLVLGWFDFPGSALAIGMTLGLIPLLALNQLRVALLRGLHWVILAEVPDLLIRPFVVLVLVGGATVVMTKANATEALTIQLVAFGGAFIAGFWLLRTRMPMQASHAVAETHGMAWLKSTMPFLGIAIINMLGSQVSLYLLGYLAGPSEAGIFQAANKMVGLIGMGLVAVNVPLQPKIAAAWVKRERGEAQRLVCEAARIGTAVACIGALVMIPFAKELLRLFGEQYIGATTALRILVLGQCINAAAGSCGLVLAMTGHQKVMLYGNSIALLFNILIAWLFIPSFGAAGAAVGLVAGLVIWNSLFVLAVWQKNRIKTLFFLK